KQDRSRVTKYRSIWTFFFSSRRRHTRLQGDWSSDVCSSDLPMPSNTPSKGWQNAPALNKLTASQQGGSRGAQLWGVAYNGRLYSIYQISPGGGWSEWAADWAGPSNPKQFYELTAAQQNNGCVQF